MKNLLKISTVFVLAMIIGFPVIAQKDDAAKKELTTKATKTARKEAKKLIKDGFNVPPGALPLDKQLENAWLKQYAVDAEGLPQYIVETGNSVAETQTAAKIQATETAKLNLAGSITTQIAALIENNIANQQLNNEEAASVTKTIAASKNMIAQELGRTLMLVEIYKKIGKNVECDIRLAYDYKNAKEIAKKVMRQELEKQTNILQDKLDKIMDLK
ncbi:MAG: hypothetical protein WCJ26_11805 [bacterium]